MCLLLSSLAMLTPGSTVRAGPTSRCSPVSLLSVRGEVPAGGNGRDGLVETVEERGAAALPAVPDPVAPGDAEGRDGELGQDVQPQVLGVQPELARQARDDLVLHAAAVVLDIGEQGRLGRDQTAGGDETLVPARIQAGPGRGQRLVQLAEDAPRPPPVAARGDAGP